VTGSVLEFYRHMLAFRRATPALRAGRTQFLNLPDPILAFTRGEGLACVFNLSDQPQSLTAKGQMAAGPAYAAVLSGNRLTLGPNGFCWLSNSQGQLPARLAARLAGWIGDNFHHRGAQRMGRAQTTAGGWAIT
jgi:alpha-glucosidase